MFSAMIIWNIWHPGRYLQGEDSEFPKKVKMSRKEKALMKREAKDNKRRNRRRSSSRKSARVSEYQLANSIEQGALEMQGYPVRQPR